jgi:phosphate transport system substrate-binding protein
MMKWRSVFFEGKKPHLNYRAIGSRAGIQELLSKETTFTCVDRPLLDEELDSLKKSKGRLVFVPLGLSGIVPTYNLKEISKPLRFTPEALTKIYLGKINTWNDPVLQKLNPEVKFPPVEITVVYHGTEHGDTLLVSRYFSQVNEEFKRNVGSGLKVKWPVGIGAKGGEGIAGTIRRIPGAIALIGLPTAKKSNCKFGIIMNKDGEFAIAKSETIAASARKAKASEHEPLEMVNAHGVNSYPICFSIFAILDMSHPHAKEAADFLIWVLSNGQNALADFDLVPLPDEIVKSVTKQIKTGTTR